MHIIKFEKDESGYRDWLKSNRNGFVVNTKPHFPRSYVVLHRASCSAISKYRKNSASDAFTGTGYVKICANEVASLLAWAKRNVEGGNFSQICSRCLQRIEQETSDVGEAALPFANNIEQQLLVDLEALNREDIPETTRLAMINARIGQGRFREDVIRIWGNGEECCLTGLAIPEILVASHIKPWKDSTPTERLDPANGLILAAHIDRLFDRHLISFARVENRYTCLLHPRLEAPLSSIGIAGMKLKRAEEFRADEASRFEKYMDEHLKKFNQKIAANKPAHNEAQ